MRGTIVQLPSGSFRVMVSAGTNPDGTRRRVKRVVKGSRRDAERERTQMLSDLDHGELAEGRQPLAQYLTSEWLPSVTSVSKRGRPLAPTTASRYAGAIAHTSGVIGSVALQDLRGHHIATLRDTLLGSGTLAAQTVADVLRVLSQALARAEALGYISRNPAAAAMVNRPVGDKPEFRTVDVALGESILNAVTGTEPWDAAAHLALGCGLRREEVLALRWSDIDGDQLTIRRTLTYADRTYHVGPPKSDAGARTLTLPGFVVRSLRRHKVAQAKRLLRVGITPDIVVDNGAGGHRSPPAFSTMWRRFALGTDFAGVTFHTLRHGYATLMLAGGVPDTVAIRLMGHADTTILRRYQEVVDDLKRDAAGTMDQLLGQGGR